MKILMVCLGNICRSPLAEGILKHKVERLGLNWEIDSAGTYGGHSGERPDKRAVKEGLKNGVNIKNQRSRRFKPFELEEYDIIFTMDSSNYYDVVRYANNNDEKSKVKMIMNELNPGENIDVPDPYYGEHGFETVFEMLDAACDKIIEKYKQEIIQ